MCGRHEAPGGTDVMMAVILLALIVLLAVLVILALLGD